MASASTRTAVQLLRVLPRERITRLVGLLTEAHVPPRLLGPVLRLYTRAYAVNMDEAVVPTQGFRSFNEFFTRKLREGVHEVDPDPHAVVSPADGRLDDAGPVDLQHEFLVKGQKYDVASLLGSEEEARTFAGGQYQVVYLSPRDYHRVHSPVAGRVALVRHIPGTLFPVNAIGVRHVPLLFARNERVVVLVDTEAFGTVAVVLVGAFVVGKISLAFEGPARPPHGGPVVTRRYDPETAPVLAAGGELGAFLLGSTVVVLLPPPDARTRGRWRDAGPTLPAPVRMGQALVRWSED